MKQLKRGFAGGVMLLICLQLATMAYIALFGLCTTMQTVDLLIVPGNTVYADGRLSERLRARLDAALRIYKQTQTQTILVSGARGLEGPDEAMAMRDYLLQQGVPATQILTDSQGYTSWDTARQSAKLIKTHKFQRVMIVSQFFHLARLQLALEKQGVQVLARTHADYFEWRDVYSLTRESIAYWSYRLFY